MKRVCAASLLVLLLFGCGGSKSTGGSTGGNTSGSNTSGGNTVGVPVDGYVLVGNGRTDGLAPLSSVTVQAYTLPVGSVPLAAAATLTSGRFIFNANLGNGLPAGTTLLLRASGGGRTISALVYTGTGGATKYLVAATHIAALAGLSGSSRALTASNLEQYEQAARTAIGASTVDYTTDANQTAAATLAQQVSAAAAQVTPVAWPTVSNVSVTPQSLDSAGGTITASLQATGSAGRSVTATALVGGSSLANVQIVPLTGSGTTFTGQFTAAANADPSTHLLNVYLLVDDGVHPLVPAAVQTVSVLPAGRVTLDILAETLVDEPASRTDLATMLDRMRPLVRRAGTRRVRQVNANQSIRGAGVVVNDVANLSGQTGNDGLLLLDVPLNAAAKGYLSLTGSISGRAPYKQFLLLPQGVALAANDRIEVNLVLATAAQWQSELADSMALGTLNFGVVPLVGFFNVTNSIDLGGLTAGSTAFRPLSTSLRTDDGDYFAANLPAGPAIVKGTYADPSVATRTLPYGPVSTQLTAGQVNSMAALTPPS